MYKLNQLYIKGQDLVIQPGQEAIQSDQNSSILVQDHMM